MSSQMIAAAKSGNVNELNALLMQTGAYAKSVVANFLGVKYSARIDAEDVTQIVLTQVARDIATCRAETMSDYLGWVSYISRNCCYKEIEKIKAAKRSADKTDSLGENVHTIASSSKTPYEIIEAQERQATIMQQAMSLAAGISDRTVQVVELLADGYESAEIAEKLGLTMNSVYGVVKRFRMAYRAQLVS